MASVYKRPEDKARGKLGKWTIVYKDETGRFRSRVGTTDKNTSIQMAIKREEEATLIREGLIDPVVLLRRRHAVAPMADHLAAYSLHLKAKGVSKLYLERTPREVGRLLAAAGIETIAHFNAVAVQGAVGLMREAGKSARTCNYSLSLVKAFANWLRDSDRIAELPRGLSKLATYNESADRRLVRRALSTDEMGKLLAAAEAGSRIKLSRRGYQYDEVWISGSQRAAVYRVAMETGFRANEIRTLTVGRFHLDGPEPTITVTAGYAKNGKRADQPITVELAAYLRPFLAGRPVDEVAFPVPEKTAKLLRVDLGAAGIPVETPDGVVDFHALRHSFITSLIRGGVMPKAAQLLARHSTVTLTLDRYAHLGKSELRQALANRA